MGAARVFPRTIIFTGGGTGGHVYPALAVYAALPEELRRRVRWIGSRRGIERTILLGSGIPFTPIPTGKLRRYLDLENLFDLFRVGAGVLRALRELRRLDGAVVFSKGGFVAVPVVVAARLLGIPVVIHESDSDPGLATRLTAPLAEVICVPYADSGRSFSWSLRRRILVSGNPVRREFFTASPERALALVGLEEDNRPVVLVTGGSLGARQLNEFVRQEFDALLDAATVIHQTGDEGIALIGELSARAAQRTGEGQYTGAPSWDTEFPPLLRRANLVVCRAGAGAIWELAVTGTPAVLVPLSSGASRGDQIRNARRYAETGAAIVPDDSFRTIAREVQELVTDPDRLKQMSAAARQFASGNSAITIAGVIARIYNRDGIRGPGGSVRS